MGTKAITHAIAALLAGIDGTGDYTHDLTGDRQVAVGMYAEPPTTALPFVCVWLVEVSEEPGPTTRSYTQSGQWAVRAWVRGHAHQHEARMDAAMDLADDIRRALRADPSLDGNVDSHSTSLTAWDEGHQKRGTRQPLGLVQAFVAATWRER